LNISTIDILVAAGYLLLTVAVGMWMGRNNRNIDDYLLAGRSIPWWALLGSIVATETSSATFLSVPGRSFVADGDFRFLQLAFGYVIGRILVVLVLLPSYFRGELLTAYELLQTRFGLSTRRIASAMFLVTRNLGDGLRMFLTALAVNLTIGLPLTTCIVITGVVTIIYTLFGGLKSVVWSDCAQFVIYMIAAAVAVWVLIDRLPGGWAQLQAYGSDHGKFRVLKFYSDYAVDPPNWWAQFRAFWADSYNIWAGVIGGACLTLGTHGTDQMMVQRCLGARRYSDAAKAMVASGFVVLFQFAVFLFIGVALASFYAQFPPEQPLKPDQAFMSFIVSNLPVGLKGLTLAGVFAAAFTSSLNACASTLIGDFGSWFGVERMSASQRLTFSRAGTFAFGVIQILVALAAAQFHLSESVVLEVLKIASFTAGILIGVFVLGQLPVRVTERGAIAGMMTGLVVLIFVDFNQKILKAISSDWSGFVIAFPWYSVIGSGLTILVGLAVSRLSPSKTAATPA
jgi:solute:Na+ symporter, SSS family